MGVYGDLYKILKTIFYLLKGDYTWWLKVSDQSSCVQFETTLVSKSSVNMNLGQYRIPRHGHIIFREPFIQGLSKIISFF